MNRILNLFPHCCRGRQFSKYESSLDTSVFVICFSVAVSVFQELFQHIYAKGPHCAAGKHLLPFIFPPKATIVCA